MPGDIHSQYRRQPPFYPVAKDAARKWQLFSSSKHSGLLTGLGQCPFRVQKLT